MDTIAHPVKATDGPHLFDSDDLMIKLDQMMQQYWDDNPDLYRIIQQKKQEAATMTSKDRLDASDSETELVTPIRIHHTTEGSTAPFFGLPLAFFILKCH